MKRWVASLPPLFLAHTSVRPRRKLRAEFVVLTRASLWRSCAGSIAVEVRSWLSMQLASVSCVRMQFARTGLHRFDA